MMRIQLGPLALASLLTGLLGGAFSCGDESRGNDDSSSGVVSLDGGNNGTSSTGGDDGDETAEKLDIAVATGGGPGCAGDLGCTDQIDLLFVIDNSGTMGEEQLNLARNFPLLIERLENLTDSAGNAVNPDVQIMVTTTDFGNRLCTGFEPRGYDPAEGAPITTPCTDRLQDFDDLFGNVSVPEACTIACPAGVAPNGNYIAFDMNGDNIDDSVMPADVNGDGTLDSPAAQALACIGPQGINGCGYESQLESMMQALDPGAPWNQGAEAFLRPNALLAIAMITDEADCSVKNYEIMSDEAFMEIDPSNDMPTASSAICWNAGVECSGPDADGVYSECHPLDAEDLHPISRYTTYLIDKLREIDHKEVIMLGILGVPEVTAHNPDPPYQPTAGGVLDLVYRNWNDGEFPTGDILPDEFAEGVTAADKMFQFGIGPGCTGGNATDGFTGQAIPPVRIRAVCEALNIDDTPEGTRCCIESICDDDFSPAIDCLTGIISEAIQPQG